MSIFRLIAIGSLVCLAAGCAQFDLGRAIPWGAGENGLAEKPMRVVAFWKETVMNRAGETSVRGFGGRMMFYAADSEKPIKVKGSLVVFAFDEEGRELTDVTPTCKYAFTSEEFAKHYSESMIGHSYSIWIPWDKSGGEQRKISLIARFTPDNGGGAIMSEQATNALSGRLPVENLSRRLPGVKRPLDDWGGGRHGNQPASYEEDAEPAPRQRMQTTTINVPTHFGGRAPTGPARPAEPDVQQRGMPAPSDAGAVNDSRAAGSPATAHPRGSSAHFERERSRALGAPLARLERDRGRLPPSRVRPPSVPRPTPSAGPSSGSVTYPQSGP